MQYIVPTNVNENSHKAAFNKLAVTKRTYPIYFPIDSGRNIGENINTTVTEFDADADASGDISAGDYIRINNETMFVTNVATAVITVERAKRGSTAASHSMSDDIYIEQDGFTITQLGAGTSVISESRIVIDLGDASFYDCSLEVKCTSGTDDTDSITLSYAFSGFSDVTIGEIETELTNTKTDLSCTFVSEDDVYFQTNTFKPTARYMYLWVTGHEDLDDENTTAKIRLNIA